MFLQKIKEAFTAVKQDMDLMRQSTNDWIVFLQEQNRDLKIRVAQLEQKLNKIEYKTVEEKMILETY